MGDICHYEAVTNPWDIFLEGEVRSYLSFALPSPRFPIKEVVIGG
jgi:hypothetical protein